MHGRERGDIREDPGQFGNYLPDLSDTPVQIRKPSEGGVVVARMKT